MTDGGERRYQPDYPASVLGEQPDSSFELRAQILDATRRYAKALLEPAEFVPGSTHIPVSGKVLAPADFVTSVDAVLDGWFTAGARVADFEHELADRVGVRHAIMVNSGSSANLLALTALTSPQLGNRQLVPGDEVISAGMSFPTTINPILQNGLRPVLVDVELGGYNAIPEQLAAAVGPRTRAIMMAHTLGNPFDLDAVLDLCRRHRLWLIEDACDALGSEYLGRQVGTFGDLATLSFYPAHQITTGEGGAILTNRPLLRRIIESFRDWGRDCYCETGEDNACRRRFNWIIDGDPPIVYDHKYVYSHVGYNMKPTDIQAALGNSQLARLADFVQARRSNFRYLRERLAGVPGLILPTATAGSDPSWFGFPLTIEPGSDADRDEFARFLSLRNIGWRGMFAGNVLRQPAYRGRDFRVVGKLVNSDTVLTRSLYLGVFPGLSRAMLDFVADSIAEFMADPVHAAIGAREEMVERGQDHRRVPHRR